jgi:multidrug efflux system membrane fusion protein
MFISSIKTNKAEIRMLKLGLSQNGQIEVLAGLKGTERVVLEGIDRLSKAKKFKLLQMINRIPAIKSAAG